MANKCDHSTSMSQADAQTTYRSITALCVTSRGNKQTEFSKRFLF